MADWRLEKHVLLTLTLKALYQDTVSMEILPRASFKKKLAQVSLPYYVEHTNTHNLTDINYRLDDLVSLKWSPCRLIC